MGIKIHPDSSRLALVAALLGVAAGVLYLPTLHHGYVFDDGLFVTDNTVVQQGLGWAGFRWAFTALTTGYWHPLTWLTHMADVELFGLDAGPRHGGGILLHVANAVLLMLLLRRMTGAFWRSAFAAALFALHPLNVESVAWTAERKGVLAGFFWLITLLAYARAARHPSPRRNVAVVGCFALALMAKPTVVPLPLVLLVLDGWPFGRFTGRGGAASPWLLLTGKAALFAMAAADSALTFFAANPGLQPLSVLPLDSRLKNAAVSVATYVIKAAWPSGLAAYYPLQPEGPPASAWIPALLGLAAVTVLAVRERRRRPWLAAGWAWYLLTLLPVAGIVQLGSYARTDRYTYLPLIGIFVIGSWAGGELLVRARRGVTFGAAAAAAILLALAVTAKNQIGHWKDDATLFTHALEVTSGNVIAHSRLGAYFAKHGEYRKAEEQFLLSLRIQPDFFESRFNLGVVLVAQGRIEEAIAQYRQALKVNPESEKAHTNLGVVLTSAGRAREALPHLQKALQSGDENASAHLNVGLAQIGLGQWNRAADSFGSAVRLDAGNAEYHFNLAWACERAGRASEAISAYRQAISLDPNSSKARFNLALLYLGRGRRAEAMTEYRILLDIDPVKAAILQRLIGPG